MKAPRPASLAQVYRLNRLKALKLIEPGEGTEITAEEADRVLAVAAARELWTPKHPRPV